MPSKKKEEVKLEELYESDYEIEENNNAVAALLERYNVLQFQRFKVLYLKCFCCMCTFIKCCFC